MRDFRALATVLLLLAALVGLSGAQRASAASFPGSRNALLIGNAAYPDSDAVLPSPVASARTLAEELKRKGFSVEQVENQTKETMQAAIDRFVGRIESGSVALVFFSGYGIQVARKNYLVPVDARIWTEADVLRDGIAVEGILEAMDKRRAGARVMILDASRRNPFERRFRSFSMGLAAAAAAPRTLTLYATAAGGVVNETNTAQNPFVTELVRQIGASEPNAEQAFAATRDAVYQGSRNQQNPALASGLEEPFYFDPSRTKPVAKAEPVTKAEPVAKVEPVAKSEPIAKPEPAAKPEPKQAAAEWADPPPSKRPVTAEPPKVVVAAKEPDAATRAEEDAVRAFDDAEATGTKRSYEDFLRRYPTGARAERARAAVARLELAARQKDPEPAPPAVKQPSTVEQRRKTSLDERIAANPDDEGAFYERGQYYALQNEYALAIADFDESIRLNPQNPEAFNNRCWMRAMMNEWQKAKGDCNQALKLRPNFVDALDSRGLVNLKVGALRAALSDYDAALKVDPNHSSALYGRGVARLRLGDTAQADKDFAVALSLNPTIDKDFAQYGLR